VNIVTRFDRYLQVAFRTLLWRNLYVPGAALFLLLVLAFTTPFDLVLRQDAFNYALKGMEIAHGDFRLYLPQAAGWPFFLSIFYLLFDTDNIFQAMFVARWISILLTCASVFAVALLARRICGEEQADGAVVVAVTAFVLSAQVQHITQVAYTEPLFMFLTLCCFCFLVSRERPGNRAIVLAALFAGLSYWVRANGLFQLFVILAMVTIWSGGRLRFILGKGGLAASVFIGAAAPHLLMRYRQFGSAFDYGPNSKYFVDNYMQVWDETIPTPTLVEYLRTHDWADYYEKFIDNGLVQIFNFMPALFNYTHFWLILLVVALLAAVVCRRRELYPLLLLFGATLAGFSIIFQVFGHVRHLIFLIPFIYLGGASLARSLSWGQMRFANIFLAGLFVYTIATREKVEILAGNHITVPAVRDTWALWAADNLTGNVALVSEGDILRMAQHYQTPAINRIPRSFAMVQEKITRVRPGEHDTLAEAVIDFRNRKIDYVITDELNLYQKHRRPYLKEIKDDRWRDEFVHLQSFAGGEPGAVLYGIDIYRLQDQ